MEMLLFGGSFNKPVIVKMVQREKEMIPETQHQTRDLLHHFCFLSSDNLVCRSIIN